MPASPPPNNDAIRLGPFLTTIVGVISLCLGAAWAMTSRQPFPADAVHTRELEPLRNEIKALRNELRNDIKELRELILSR